MADIAFEASGAEQFIFDGRAVVRDHTAESYRDGAVVYDGMEEIQIFFDGGECGRRFEEHKAELIGDIEVF